MPQIICSCCIQIANEASSLHTKQPKLGLECCVPNACCSPLVSCRKACNETRRGYLLWQGTTRFLPKSHYNKHPHDPWASNDAKPCMILPKQWETTNMHYIAQSRGKREQNLGVRRVCTIDIYSSVQRFSRIEQIQVHVEEPRPVEIFTALHFGVSHNAR